MLASLARTYVYLGRRCMIGEEFFEFLAIVSRLYIWMIVIR